MKFCWVVFGVLVGFLVVIVSPLRESLHINGDLSDFVIPLGVIGALLVILAILTEISRVLRSFLITTGASAIGWPGALYLHNILFRFFPTEPFTYVLVFYVFPITFIVGAVGAMTIGIKQLVSSR